MGTRNYVLEELVSKIKEHNVIPLDRSLQREAPDPVLEADAETVVESDSTLNEAFLFLSFFYLFCNFR